MKKILFAFFISSVTLAQSPVSGVSVYTDTLEPFLNAQIFFAVDPLFAAPLGLNSLDTTKTASASNSGFLNYADWVKFNSAVGTVTSIATSEPITGGTITGAGTISADTTNSTYGLATNYELGLKASISSFASTGVDTADYTVWGWNGLQLKVPWTRMPKLDAANTFTKYNTFSKMLTLNDTLKFSDLAGSFHDINTPDIATTTASTGFNLHTGRNTDNGASGNSGGWNFYTGSSYAGSTGGYSFVTGNADTSTLSGTGVAGSFTVNIGSGDNYGAYILMSAPSDGGRFTSNPLSPNQGIILNSTYYINLHGDTYVDAALNIPRDDTVANDGAFLAFDTKRSGISVTNSYDSEPRWWMGASFDNEGTFGTSRNSDMYLIPFGDQNGDGTTRRRPYDFWITRHDGTWRFGINDSVFVQGNLVADSIQDTGILSVTGATTLGGLTVNANAKQNITLSDTVSISGQLNAGSSGTAQSHYIYAGVDTTFIGRTSSQYLELFGNGSNNNLMSRGNIFNFGTTDANNLDFYYNNSQRTQLDASHFTLLSPFNQTTVWQADTSGDMGVDVGASTTYLVKIQNNVLRPNIIGIFNYAGTTLDLFDSLGIAHIGGTTGTASKLVEIVNSKNLTNFLALVSGTSVTKLTIDSSADISTNGTYTGKSTVSIKPATTSPIKDLLNIQASTGSVTVLDVDSLDVFINGASNNGYTFHAKARTYIDSAIYGLSTLGLAGTESIKPVATSPVKDLLNLQPSSSATPILDVDTTEVLVGGASSNGYTAHLKARLQVDSATLHLSTVTIKPVANVPVKDLLNLQPSSSTVVFDVDSLGHISEGNGLALVGNGAPYIVYKQDSSAITAKNTSAVTMITPSNAVHHWECGVSLTCTTLGATSTWTVKLGYTDVSAVTYSWPTAATTATGGFSFPTTTIRTSNNTAITATVVVTGTAPIVNYSIWLKQLD